MMTSDDCPQLLLSQKPPRNATGGDRPVFDQADFVGPPKSVETLPGFANSSVSTPFRPVLSRKASKAAGSCCKLPFFL
jgi:hypothetical protein